MPLLPLIAVGHAAHLFSCSIAPVGAQDDRARGRVVLKEGADVGAVVEHVRPGDTCVHARASRQLHQARQQRGERPCEKFPVAVNLFCIPLSLSG